MKKYLILIAVAFFVVRSTYAQGSPNYFYQYNTVSQHISNKVAMKKALAKKKKAAKKPKKDSIKSGALKKTSFNIKQVQLPGVTNVVPESIIKRCPLMKQNDNVTISA